MRVLFGLGLFGLGVGLCSKAFRGIDGAVVWRDLRRAGPWVILLMLAPVVGNFLHMLGWRALVERDLRPKLWRSFRIFVAAQAGNEIGASVMGESLKVVAFRREARTSAMRAVLWDNLTSLVALGCVLMTLTAVPAYLGSSLSMGRLVGLILGITTMAIAVAWLGRKVQVCARPPIGNIAFAFCAHYFGRCWIVAEYALALALIATASVYSSALLGFASILGSSIGAAIPGQIGAIEGALVSIAQLARVSIPTVLSIAILRRVRTLIWVMIGAAFCLALGQRFQSWRLHGSLAGH